MQVRMAGIADLEILLPLMRGYYAADGLEFNEARARASATRLLSEPHWGGVYLLQDFVDIGGDLVGGGLVGYIAICLGFSLELGGNDAIVDEMFILPQYRGRGLGNQGLRRVIEHLATRHVRALHLEVDADNARAQRMYASLGFNKRDRYFIMTRELQAAEDLG